MSAESGYNPDKDEKLSEEQKALVKKVLKDEKGKPDVVITVEKKEESDKEKEANKFWSEALNDIQKEYEKLGKNFDPSSIKSTEDIKRAFEEISDLREQKPRQATQEELRRFGRELGTEEPTGDRDIQALKEATRDLPLDMVEYNSESEMRNFLLELSKDTNDSRCAEATKLYSKLLNRAMSDNVNLELTSTGSEYAQKKGKFRNVKKRED
jgi:hypothetical protein